uniref:HTH CENPB-type domain-containing protein n=1 Tax=Peronospora matthiolae TaxID=2874970 RepID=A0AAV1U7C4_9STRA
MASTRDPPEKTIHPRTTFTNAQRLQICTHREQNPNLTQNQLATWAHETFELPRKPSQAMISKLLKRKPDLEIMTTEELTCKSRRTVRFPRLDTALARWVSYCEETGVTVTGESIRLKAVKFAEILQIDTPLTFSNGWLYKFNERHGFGSLKSHKESKTSSEEAVADLQRRLHAFDPRNVFSMDETGLLFTLFPDQTGKQTSKRLTIALCCNADGSEKLPLLLIGKTEKPRGFTHLTASEENYKCNQHALMTREFFLEWITNLDAKFRKEQRKCVLIIDHSAVHAGFNAEELKNVEVVFLPLGTVKNLHPLTAGIVAAFKRRYRQRQIQHMLDHMDADAGARTLVKLDSVGVRQAMSWCNECWNAVPSSLIVRCWQDAALLFSNSFDDTSDCRGQEDAISEELAVMLTYLHATNPLSVEELLNLPEESVIMDDPTDEDFCTPVESARVAVQPKTGNAADAENGLSVEELKEHLKWIAKLLLYANEKDMSAESVSGMRILQRDFRNQLDKKQSSSS